MYTYTLAKNGLTHACDGTVLDDGTTTAWRVCDGAYVPVHALIDEVKPSCSACRKMVDAAAIASHPVLAWGPPELVSSSWPRAFR